MHIFLNSFLLCFAFVDIFYIKNIVVLKVKIFISYLSVSFSAYLCYLITVLMSLASVMLYVRDKLTVTIDCDIIRI